MGRLLILDFDGTMTDAEREGIPFRQGYLEDIAALCDRPVDEVLAMAEGFEAQVAADKGAYGWLFNGRIVAPAAVDPYLRIMPVARMVLDAAGVFSNEPERTRLLDAVLYKYNYQKTGIVFREGARELLCALAEMDGVEAYVVTNSHTDPVRHKISVLGGPGGELDWLAARVHGRAKKYVIDDSFDAVPAELEVPGLARPVLLRRRHYADVREDLRARHGVAWPDVRVVGDIFELDLSLPIQLGAHVALVRNTFTPAYERDYLTSHPRGAVLDGLSDVAAWVGAV